MARYELEIHGRRYLVADWVSAGALERRADLEPVPAWVLGAVVVGPGMTVFRVREGGVGAGAASAGAGSGASAAGAPGEAGVADAAATEPATPAGASSNAGSSAGAPAERGPADEGPRRDWIEVVLLDETDAPVVGARCLVTLPNGSQLSYRTDRRGVVRVDNIPVGQCQVRFPDLDQDAWAPI